VRAVLLDALGTLVRLEPPGPALAARLSARTGAEVPLEHAERAIAAEIAYYRRHFDEGRDEASVNALRRRCAAVVADALPGVSNLDPDAWLEVLLASLQFSAFGDVVPALGLMRDAGLRLVVVSNWDWSLHAVLGRIGLEPLLDGVITSAEVGARKPDGAIFARGLSLAGVSADEAMHVGDSADEDVRGAGAAGITPVMIRRDGGPGPDGVRTVHTLMELAS
jgi:putative hydrolase of the HAD superfamily